MVKFFKNWLAKETFYKMKCIESLEELDRVLRKIEQNQAEIEILKRQIKDSLKRVEKALNNLGKTHESNTYDDYQTRR